MPESKWTRMQIIPYADLEAWHALDLASSGQEILDFSGQNRHLECPSDEPVLAPYIRNGLPALYFDGANNPVSFSGNLMARHIFIVASFDGETFDGNEGLLSDLETTALLAGQGSGSNKFYNLGYADS